MAKVNLRAYNREIETMIDRGQLDEAVAHCFHILKSFPKHLETYRLLGKAYLEHKRYKEAVDIFSRVLAAAPNDFVANVGMSIIRDEEGKLDDAIWHMERAFEVQPSNSAIQSELQRLYGRRDGVQPPRIRMTRGALAHMYVNGELYPQAISEIKSVLKEDAGRSDMQALLARAHFRSGQKNEAAEVASALLRRYPYCLDANRVLAEILDAEKPENAQMYRGRVVELDPYAAQVNGPLAQSGEAPDAAVSLDRLDWNGQPVGPSVQADWRETRAIGLVSGAERDEQPDWLRNAAAPAVPSQPGPAPVQEAALPAQPTPDEEIPDFLRDAGWSKSTGAFDESQSAFAVEEPSAPAQPLEQGDLPDWVKAMAPKAEEQPPAEEEELPDWINKIGPAGAAAATATAASGMDWLDQIGQPSQPAGEQPDWLKGIGEIQPEASSESMPAGEPDWLRDLGQGAASEPAQPASDLPDWLKGLGEETPAAQPEAETDWLSQFDVKPQPVAETPAEDFSFLDEKPAEPQAATPPVAEPGALGTTEKEQDDSFAWLEALAAKQGASEGLLTKPEERLQEEPDWVKQARGLEAQPEPVPADDTAAWLRSLDQDAKTGEPEFVEDETAIWLKGLDEDKVAPAAAQPPVEDLGKSEQERDDSFAWLEALAAKQGANEGLLTKPEERLDQEPEWVKKVKSSTGPLSEQKPPEDVAPPAEPAAVASAEELGRSEQERDDSFAWLESLAAKQGASEGLLTKPEERLEQEPEWVKQARDLTQPAAEKPAAAEETTEWLRSLDEGKQSEPVSAADDTAMWLKSLDEAESVPAPVEAAPAEAEMPSWLQEIEQEEPVAAEPAVPAEEAAVPAAVESAGQPVAEAPREPEGEELPGWLSGFEEEKSRAEVPPSASREELPAWLRDETGELVAEPTKIEPTRATDWHPVEGAVEETPAPEPEPPAVAPVAETQEKPKPKPAKKSKPAEPKPEYREPVTMLRGGMMVDPLLVSARNELSRSNIPGALDVYGKLIKKARYLDEVIYDLREALYRYPVEVSIWQSLGDAYMRANRLQDALDAYTKAEELLR